jgi:Kef-type K+ transport system membrane component KefB
MYSTQNYYEDTVFLAVFIMVFHNAHIVPLILFCSGIEGNIRTRLKRYQSGALGIGAMIVFIAMVLVAGIAAYVILSTSSQLELKSSTTGSQTLKEVSTGIKIRRLRHITPQG